MSQANQNTMRRLIDEVINNKDLGVLDEIIHGDYVYRTPDQQLHGSTALGELLTAYHAAFPDLHVSIDELLSTDNKAVLFFTLNGTHQNELMGMPASGKQVKVHGAICSHFKDEKIIEEWELLDQLSLFQQLGMVSI